MRIAVFTVCLMTLSLDEVFWFSRLPLTLQFPPPSLEKLAPHLPINAPLVALAATVYMVACVFAILGLFTRPSAIAVVISGLYVLGVPELYGKINHYHHVLWFAAILAFSPCADILSLDAVRRGWKAADRGQLVRYAPSTAYAVPLRLIWLLIGIIYFFPGYWKARIAGLSWAIGPTFANLLHEKWFELGWWTPIIPIDRFPLLLTIAAFGTIAWELSFVFMVIPRRTRPVAAACGTLFHTMTAIFMSIWFWDLNLLYLSFFDLHRGLKWVGAKLSPTPMDVIYDGDCRFCRRAVASFRALDILGRIEWIAAADRAGQNALQIGTFARDAPQEIQAVVGCRVWRGFGGYRALARRIPLLWPLVPFLYLPPVEWIGNLMYGAVCDRLCNTHGCGTSISESRGKQTILAQVPSSRPVGVVMLIGLSLIVLNSGAGIKGTNSWPISTYPTFAGPWPDTTSVITMDIEGHDGEREVIGTGQATSLLPVGSERLNALVAAVLRLPAGDEQQRALTALMTVYSDSVPLLKDARSVRFYADVYSLDPNVPHGELLSRQELFEFEPS